VTAAEALEAVVAHLRQEGDPNRRIDCFQVAPGVYAFVEPF